MTNLRHGTRLALTLSAVAIAAAAQFMAATHGWPSAAAFLVAMVLFGAATPLSASAPTRPPAQMPSLPRRFWPVFGAATMACVLSGELVRSAADPRLSQGLWFAGLATLFALVARKFFEGVPRPAWSLAAAAAGLLLCATLVFAVGLAHMPPEVHDDEAEVGLDAVRILTRQPFNLFTIGWYDLPAPHALPAAIGLEVAGVNLWGLRLPSALLGVACVALLMVLARPWWGAETALLAAALLLSQRFFIHLSRTGFHYIHTPAASLLALVLLRRLWRELHLGSAIACGMIAAFAMMTYYPTRLVPALLAATCVLAAASSERAVRSARLALLAIAAWTGAAVLAPIIGLYWSYWDLFWSRLGEVSIFSAESAAHLAQTYGTESIGLILARQLAAALTLFNATHDTSVQYGLAGPLFDPVSATLFPLGVAVLVRHLRQPSSRITLLWLAVPVLLGAALTLDTPFFPRISGAVPFAVLAVAVALHAVLERIRDALPGAAGRTVAALTLAAALTTIVSINLHTYFVDYAPSHRHNSPAIEVAAWVRANAVGKTTYFVGRDNFASGNGALRFLTRGYDTRDAPDLEALVRDPGLEVQRSAFVVLPAQRELIPRLSAALGAADIQEHPDFRGAIGFFTVTPQAPGAAR